jgi:hypothetical protein
MQHYFGPPGQTMNYFFFLQQRNEVFDGCHFGRKGQKTGNNK